MSLWAGTVIGEGGERMSIYFKPCPFCGYSGYMKNGSKGNKYGNAVSIACPICKAKGPVVFQHKGDYSRTACDEAIQAWNRRVR